MIEDRFLKTIVGISSLLGLILGLGLIIFSEAFIRMNGYLSKSVKSLEKIQAFLDREIDSTQWIVIHRISFGIVVLVISILLGYIYMTSYIE